MKHLFLLLLFYFFSVVQAQENGDPVPGPVGTAFTYQGLLELDGKIVSGRYDFSFRLYDVPSGGTQVTSSLQFINVLVTQGVFNVSLDYGDAFFMGNAMYLEILVRETGTTVFFPLNPRQRINTVPYAIQSAFTEESGSPWLDQNGGIIYQDGNVSIGSSFSNASKLQVEAPNGTSPLRIRLEGLGTRLRVHGNGGTSLGSNTVPPVNGLHVLGEVRQPLTQHSFAKAGLRFICGNSATTIFESFNNVNDDDIVVTSNLPEAGRCEITFPFDITDSYVVSNPFAVNIIRAVSCGKTTNLDGDLVECNGYNPLSDVRTDVVVTLLLF